MMLIIRIIFQALLSFGSMAFLLKPLYHLLPRTGVIRCALFRHRYQVAELGAEMDRLVGREGYAYQVAGIHQVFRGVLNILNRERIHMMDENFALNVVSFHAQVTSVIAEDDDITDALPLFRAVKHLVELSVVTKCLFANLAEQSKVGVTLGEGREVQEFIIGSGNLIHHCPDKRGRLRLLWRRDPRCALRIRETLSSL